MKTRIEEIEKMEADTKLAFERELEKVEIGRERFAEIIRLHDRLVSLAVEKAMTKRSQNRQ